MEVSATTTTHAPAMIPAPRREIALAFLQCSVRLRINVTLLEFVTPIRASVRTPRPPTAPLAMMETLARFLTNALEDCVQATRRSSVLSPILVIQLEFATLLQDCVQILQLQMEPHATMAMRVPIRPRASQETALDSILPCVFLWDSVTLLGLAILPRVLVRILSRQTIRLAMMETPARWETSAIMDCAITKHQCFVSPWINATLLDTATEPQENAVIPLRQMEPVVCSLEDARVEILVKEAHARLALGFIVKYLKRKTTWLPRWPLWAALQR